MLLKLDFKREFNEGAALLPRGGGGRLRGGVRDAACVTRPDDVGSGPGGGVGCAAGVGGLLL